MKVKNLFYVVVALLAISIFISCKPNIITGPGGDTIEINKPDYEETDQVYLCGNCSSSDMSAAILGYGDGQSHTFGGASLLPVGKLLEAGYYIVGVRVYIGGEVESGEVFVGPDYNAPDVTKSFTYKKGGWQYVLFDQPYDFQDSVYIGFMATGNTDFMALESAKKSSKTEMIYLEGSWGLVDKNIGRYVWAIQAIVVGGDYSSENQYDVVLERSSVSKSVKEGEVVSVSCELRAAGIIPAENVTIKCTLGDETKHINVSEKLMNGQSILVNFDGFTAPTIEKKFETVNISFAADYSEDNLKSNNSLRAKLNVYTADAVERDAILIEQFTGQGCGYCPGGAEVLKTAILGMENPNKTIWVAHHYGYTADEFTLLESEIIGGNLGVQGAPNCVIDRLKVEYAPGQSALCWHPGYSTTALLEDLVKTPGLATIELNRTFNAADSTLSVEVKGNSLIDEAFITVLVKQSGIVARQSNGGNNYQHNNAPRAFLTNAKGDTLVLENGNYSVNYTYKIPAKVGNFACVLDDMEVVAFVHGGINKEQYGARLVYNAIQVPILEEQTQKIMRTMSLYGNIYNIGIRSLSEEICY